MLIMTYVRLAIAFGVSLAATVAALFFVYHNRYGEAVGVFLVGMALAVLLQPGDADLAAWDDFVRQSEKQE